MAERSVTINAYRSIQDRENMVEDRIKVAVFHGCEDTFSEAIPDHIMKDTGYKFLQYIDESGNFLNASEMNTYLCEDYEPPEELE